MLGSGISKTPETLKRAGTPGAGAGSGVGSGITSTTAKSGTDKSAPGLSSVSVPGGSNIHAQPVEGAASTNVERANPSELPKLTKGATQNIEVTRGLPSNRTPAPSEVFFFFSPLPLFHFSQTTHFLENKASFEYRCCWF